MCVCRPVYHYANVLIIMLVVPTGAYTFPCNLLADDSTGWKTCVYLYIVYCAGIFLELYYDGYDQS